MTLLGIALCVVGILLLSHSLQRQSLLRALAREVRSGREREQELSIRLDDLTTKLNNTATLLTKQSGMAEKRLENLEERISRGQVGTQSLALVSEADRELQDRLERLERIAESPALGLALDTNEPEAHEEPVPGGAAHKNEAIEEAPAPSLTEVLTPWRELLFRDLTALATASNQAPKKFIELLKKALRDHQLEGLLTESVVKQIASSLSPTEANGRAGAFSPSVLAALLEASFKDKFPASAPINWKPAAGERRLRTLLLVGAERSGKTTAAVGLAREALTVGARVILADCTPDHRTSGISLTSWNSATHGLDVVAPIVNSKPHHVAYKAIHRAQDEKADLLLLDTPSGFTSKGKVSEAVTNIAAMIAREQPYPPHDTILVLDASSPEQALAQGKRFLSEGSFSGLLLTHIDKITSPGALVAIAEGLEIPLWHLNYGVSGREIARFNPVTLSKAFWAPSAAQESNPASADEEAASEELRP